MFVVNIIIVDMDKGAVEHNYLPKPSLQSQSAIISSKAYIQNIKGFLADFKTLPCENKY